MPIQIRECYTPNEALDKLDEIHKSLQEPGSATHDTWDWMEAALCIEVLRASITPALEQNRSGRLAIKDAITRLECMALPDQQTWDLSEKDVAAIALVVSLAKQSQNTSESAPTAVETKGPECV